MATSNYSWNLPTVGGSEDTWGASLNANWTALDTLLGGVSQAQLNQLDGNIFSGNLTVDTNTLFVDAANKRVGIGTDSPVALISVPIGTTPTLSQTAATAHSAGNVGSLGLAISDGGGYSGVFVHNTHNGTYSSQDIRFLTAEGGVSSATERMRIASNGFVGFAITSPTYMIHLNGGAATFSNSGIAAAWNLHSDYRLKENVVEFSGASSLVSQLRPVRFSWVGEDTSEATTAGFIAHEMAEVAPYSVVGEKDAVNEDGSIKSQAADYSKLVPLLTAALQEALQKIEALEARVTALEA